MQNLLGLFQFILQSTAAIFCEHISINTSIFNYRTKMKNQDLKSSQIISFPNLNYAKKSMNACWKVVLSLLLIAFTISCDKNEAPKIDHGAAAEKRILEVSEQSSISEEDIVTLEKLNSQVTDRNKKASLAQMIESVKIIKELLESLGKFQKEQLSNFKEDYAKLQEQHKKITDKLPRKAKLLKELEALLLKHNTEEIEFPKVVLENAGLAKKLLENYNIKPIQGKPTKYLRKDLERVDRLEIYLNNINEQAGMAATVFRYFKGLKYLAIGSKIETVWDLNQMKSLETLILDINQAPKSWELKMDELNNLKHLEIKGERGSSPFAGVIDFTDKFPLLETLILPKIVTTSLTALVLPNKQHLKTLSINQETGFPKMKRLVIEAKAIEDKDFSFSLGAADNLEIEEVRLSGFKQVKENTTFAVLAAEDLIKSKKRITIKKFSLKNINASVARLRFLNLKESLIENVKFGDKVKIQGNSRLIVEHVDFPSKPDFAWIGSNGIYEYKFQFMTFGGSPLVFADIQPMVVNKANQETVNTLWLTGSIVYSNKTVDLKMFNKLVYLRLMSADAKGVLIEKLILKLHVGRGIVVSGEVLDGVKMPFYKWEYVE